jgi:hypothetical protein
VALLTPVLVLGAAAQFLLAARGGDLLTAHFSPQDLALVPGQTLARIHERGFTAVVLAVVPFAAALAGLVSHGPFTSRWTSSLKRAASWMACADVLVLLAALLTTA